MVLPAPSADDAPRPGEHGWIERLSAILHLTKRGVLVLVDGAAPEMLGTLVRALLPEHPDLEVHTDARALADAPEGAEVILCPDPAQAEWLNLERPVFADRALRVILFCPAAVSASLARTAPDFFNWISHRIECPRGPSLPAVRGLRAALAHRARGVAWIGGDLDAAFAAALPRRPLVQVSATTPYDALVGAACGRGRAWIGWTDVDGPFRLRRVRWAMAEAGRRGRAILVQPAVGTSGFWPVNGRAMDVGVARGVLRNGGAPQPGRLAALLDLEPEAVKLVAKMLRAGFDARAIESAVIAVEDGGEKVARLAMQAQVARQRPTPPVLRAVGRAALAEGGDEIERALRQIRRGRGSWAWLAEEAIKEGDPEVAERWARRALETDADRSEAQYGCGLALYHQGKLGEAERVLRDVAQRHPVKWRTHATLAMVLARQARLAEAEGVLRKAVTYRMLASTTDADAVPLLQDLGMVYAQQGKHEDAEILLRQALAIEERTRRHARRAFMTSRYGLARILQRREQYAEAEKLARRALADTEDLFGVEHSYFATCLHGLAAALARQGRYEDAEGCLRRALSIKEKSLGVDHPSYAASLLDLGEVLSHAGKYGEADGALSRAISLQERTLGADHPDYAAALDAFARLRLLQGRYEESTELYKKALLIRERVLGRAHPEYLTSVGGFAQASYERKPRGATTFKEIGRTLGDNALSFEARTVELFFACSHHLDRIAEDERGDYAHRVFARVEKLAFAWARTMVGSTVMMVSLLGERAHSDGNSRVNALFFSYYSVLCALARHHAASGQARRAIDALKRAYGPHAPVVRDMAPILERIAREGR